MMYKAKASISYGRAHKDDYLPWLGVHGKIKKFKIRKSRPRLTQTNRVLGTLHKIRVVLRSENTDLKNLLGPETRPKSYEK